MTTPMVARPGRKTIATLVLCFFVVIALVCWDSVTQIPVWDESMSVFPAAITISESGLDIFEQPGFGSGGPNVHAFSLVTWLTAGATLLNGTPPFTILHLLHFLIAAIALTGFVLLLRPNMGWLFSLGTAVVALSIPIVRSQVGAMYLEVALLACTVWAMKAWTEGRPIAAGIWAAAAVLVKPSGVIVAGGLVLADLLVRRHRVAPRHVLALCGPSIVLGAALLLATPKDGETAQSFASTLASSLWYLLRVPDIVVLIGLALALFVVHVFGSQHSVQPKDKRMLALLGSMGLAFVSFYALLPAIAWASPVLPRYLVMVIPLLVAFVVMLVRLKSRVAAATVLVSIFAFSIVNSSGRFYPDNDSTNFALIERSQASRDLSELHKLAMREIENLPKTIPLFYDRASHYRNEYPDMGYVAETRPLSYLITHTPEVASGSIADFPPLFAMYLENPFLGGETVADVWRQAADSPAYSVDMRTITSEQFESLLIQIRRID